MLFLHDSRLLPPYLRQSYVAVSDVEILVSPVTNKSDPFM